MHEPLLLTINEIREITGYKYCSKHRKWFQENGFSFTIGRDGYPRVLRQHFKDVMGFKPKEKRRVEPNFDALRA